MSSAQKPIPKTPQEERRPEIEATYSTASNATKHFINKQGARVTSIPLGTGEIRRLARLEHSLKKRKVTSGRANRIFAGLSLPGTARGLLSEDHLAQRWLCSKSRMQKRRSAGQGPAYLKIGKRVLYRPADIVDSEQERLVSPTAREVH